MNKYFASIFVLMTSLSLTAFACDQDFKEDQATEEVAAVEADEQIASDTFDTEDSVEVAACDEFTE